MPVDYVMGALISLFYSFIFLSFHWLFFLSPPPKNPSPAQNPDIPAPSFLSPQRFSPYVKSRQIAVPDKIIQSPRQLPEIWFVCRIFIGYSMYSIDLCFYCNLRMNPSGFHLPFAVRPYLQAGYFHNLRPLPVEPRGFQIEEYNGPVCF